MSCFSQVNMRRDDLPVNIKKLMNVYPNLIWSYNENTLVFKDKSIMIYDDLKEKTDLERLENSDIEDQFNYTYELGKINDAGRYRNEVFFKKIYGNSKSEVEKKLVEIVWCPKLVNQKIKVTSVNGIDKIVNKISAELDEHPEFQKYINNIGGTFNWRTISGTNRLSMHSFGMTIDINAKHSDYWQWSCNCKNENYKIVYKNKIPLEIVKIFQKYGFIWGGNWKHFDTMHFEYRPEFFVNI